MSKSQGMDVFGRRKKDLVSSGVVARKTPKRGSPGGETGNVMRISIALVRRPEEMGYLRTGIGGRSVLSTKGNSLNLKRSARPMGYWKKFGSAD